MRVIYSFISSFGGVTQMQNVKSDLHAVHIATKFCVENKETLMSVWRQNQGESAYMIMEPGDFDN